jgi:endoglucanase
MRTTHGSVSDAFSPRRRRLATTVATLALSLAAGTVGARASGGVSNDTDAATKAPTVVQPPIYAPSSSAAYRGTPDNPLVRPWGVYQGPSEMPWLPYLAAPADQQALLDKIVQRPKATWFGAWQPNIDITERVENYLAMTTGGDPDVLAQITIFRMVPWERDACDRLPTAAEQASYYEWIDGFAAGVHDTHLAVVMQPDAPFGLCAPGGSQLPLHMVRYAVRKLSALANTSVYIEAGAADWLRDDPQEALKILVPAGIRDARGFALNGTHYDSTERQIRFSAAISKALKDRGIPGKYAVINTAENGRPFKGYEYDGPNFDNARVCTSAEERRCVTLGIPPTIDVDSPQWGLPAADRKLADRYVDAYLWFGRPWLFNQAQPFDLQRALQLTRTTPYS